MYLVLNLGLKSIRAIVFGEKGKVVVNCSQPLTTVLNGDVVEQLGSEWWVKGIQVINEALENENIRANIRYMTVTASSCCLVPVNASGEPLSNIIMVSDKRASKESIFISNLESYQNIRKQRNDFEIKSSLMLPKMLWLKNNRRNLFDEAAYFLSPNDYFGLRLTGRAAVDIFNAEKCFFDAKTNTYPAKLLEDLGIPVEKLPEVVQVGDVLSQVSNDFKHLINVKNTQSIDYVVSTYDALCAFYGSGVAESGDTCDVSGTVTSLRTLAKGKVDISSTAIFSQYQPEFDVSIIGGSNNLGGGLIEWAKQAFYGEHDSPYELMENEAKKVPNGADGVLFLPYLMGERSPLWNDDARGVFFGLSRNHKREHMMRAVFESTGFSLRNILEEIENTGRDVRVVRSSGGLSRIHLIAQIKADILGKEVHILDEYETTALGAYLLMGISTGLYKDLEDASSVVRIREIVFPNLENYETFSKSYKIFKDIYTSLLGAFADHSKLQKGNVFSRSDKIENM